MIEIFPAWRTDIKVLPPRGSKLPTRELKKVLVVPASQEDQAGFSEAVDVEANLYITNPRDTPPESTNRIQVPDSHPMRGLWQVVGEPAPWPKGTHVQLRRIHHGKGNVQVQP